MKSKKLITVLACLSALAACGVWTWRTQFHQPKFNVPLHTVGKFGMYKVVGNFGYGTNGQLLSVSSTFYIIPFTLILAFLVVVALLVFLIFGLPRLIRTYNQSIINQAKRRR